MVKYAKFEELSFYEIYEIFKLRQNVFIVEQGIISEADIDEFDKKCVHFFIKWDGVIVSYLRVIQDFDNVRVGRVCTDINFRGRGFATMLFREVLNRYETVVLSAQLKVIPFYKSLGFTPVANKYKDAGIWHQKMIRIK